MDCNPHFKPQVQEFHNCNIVQKRLIFKIKTKEEMLITKKLETWTSNSYYSRYATLSSFHTSKFVPQVKKFTQSPLISILPDV
jgi:hypothetical protein